jgi:DNA-binding XRE family transcriptional regulator
MKDRIVALMKNMGMSQKVFAAEICISEGALSSIFSGRTKPTLNTVNNIHERFPEVNMGWLIDGKGEMYNAASSDSSKQDANVMDFSGAVPSGGVPVQPGFLMQPNVVPLAVPSAPYSAEDGKKLDKPTRRIAEIRVFYNDGTFETFPGKA